MVTGFEQLARELIATAHPDDCAPYSFADYHARGVMYLNLLRAADLTCKLYLLDGFEPHEWLVAPHNHAYAFHSTVLYGEMRHGLFDVHPKCDGEWRHRFIVDSRGPTFTPRGESRIALAEQKTLRRGETYYLPADRVHTIGVSRPTVLFLCQYQRERERTDLYTEAPKAPNLAGLYHPVTPDVYAERLGHVCRLLEGVS